MESATIAILSLFFLPLALGILITLLASWGQKRLEQMEKQSSLRPGRMSRTVFVVAALFFTCILLTYLVAYRSQINSQGGPSALVDPSPFQQGAVPAGRPRRAKFVNSSPISSSPAGEANKFIAFIQRKQRQYVRDSIGLEANQCYTDVMLQQFKEDNTVVRLVESLAADQEFQTSMAEIRSLPAGERDILLKQGADTYRRAWDKLGLNPEQNSPDELRRGQTLAGEEAESLIAKAIVALV